MLAEFLPFVILLCRTCLWRSYSLLVRRLAVHHPSTCLSSPTHFHPVTPSRCPIPTCILHALPLFTIRHPVKQHDDDDDNDDDELLVNVKSIHLLIGKFSISPSIGIADIVIIPEIHGHYLHHLRSRGLLNGDAVRQCARRAAVRLRRGPPWLRHADGDSHRNGEFLRVDLVGNDARHPLRRQSATCSPDLGPRLDPAELVGRLAPAGPDPNIARSTSIGSDSTASAHGEREFDLAERLLGREQQCSGPSSHTREKAHRNSSGLNLRRRDLCRALRNARRSRSDTPLALLVSRLPRRLELQSPSPPGHPLHLISWCRISKSSPGVRRR